MGWNATTGQTVVMILHLIFWLVTIFCIAGAIDHELNRRQFVKRRRR